MRYEEISPILASCLAPPCQKKKSPKNKNRQQRNKQQQKSRRENKLSSLTVDSTMTVLFWKIPEYCNIGTNNVSAPKLIPQPTTQFPHLPLIYICCYLFALISQFYSFTLLLNKPINYFSLLFSSLPTLLSLSVYPLDPPLSLSLSISLPFYCSLLFWLPFCFFRSRPITCAMSVLYRFPTLMQSQILCERKIIFD